MKRKWFKRGILGIGLAGILLVVGSHWYIEKSTEAFTYDSTTAIPYNRVGLVLGTNKGGSRGLNQFFVKRMKAAADLYKAGKVEILLVSGGNPTHQYNEAEDMKNYLMELGVPAKAIVLDFAGYRTLDSVVRCKEVFGQAKVTIISQAYHNKRALFIAKGHGLDAVAYNAASVGRPTPYREYFARTKAVLDVFVFGTAPRYLGEPETI